MNRYTPAIQNALYTCQDHTRHTGNEMAILLDKDDQFLLQKAGNEHFVQFELGVDGPAFQRAEGGVLLHSHPHENTLSLPDLKFSNKCGMPIYAITPSGAVFASNGVLDPVSFMEYKHTLEDVGYLLNRALQGTCVADSDLGVWEHDVLQEAARRGYMHYECILSKEFSKRLLAVRSLEWSVRVAELIKKLG